MIANFLYVARLLFDAICIACAVVLLWFLAGAFSPAKADDDQYPPAWPLIYGEWALWITGYVQHKDLDYRTVRFTDCKESKTTCVAVMCWLPPRGEDHMDLGDHPDWQDVFGGRFITVPGQANTIGNLYSDREDFRYFLEHTLDDIDQWIFADDTIQYTIGIDAKGYRDGIGTFFHLCDMHR